MAITLTPPLKEAKYFRKNARDCDVCGIHYIGYGRLCCSRKCASKRPEYIEVQRRGTKSRKTPPALGKHWKLKDSTKKKIGDALRGRKKPWLSEKQVGPNNPSWKGGSSYFAKSVRASSKYKDWRDAVMKRDCYSCVICEKHGGKLNADHKVGFAQIIHEHGVRNFNDAMLCAVLWETENGRTLCEPCHRKTPSYAIKVKDHDTIPSSC